MKLDSDVASGGAMKRGDGLHADEVRRIDDYNAVEMLSRAALMRAARRGDPRAADELLRRFRFRYVEVH